MKKHFLVIVLLASTLMAACNMETPATSTPDMNLIYTIAAQTVAAQGTIMAATLQVTPTPPPTATPTAPMLPTAQLTPPTPSLPTPPPVVATSASTACDRASFVTDVTIPDGSMITAGQSFTKTWRLMNAGSCTWSTAYKVVYVSGDLLGAASSLALNQTVPPGSTIDVSVPMVGPTTNGTFTGYWKLQNASGQQFGLGAAASTFSVVISIGSGTAITAAAGTVYPTATITYFAVQSASSWSVSPSSYSGKCPVTITIDAVMTASMAGNVTYHFIRSNGTVSSSLTKTYTGSGNVNIEDKFDVSSTGTYSDALYVDSPNHTNFGGPSSFTVTCATATP